MTDIPQPHTMPTDVVTALFGLLSVAWDATFVDSDGISTACPWLVLHLDLVRAPTQTAFAAAVHSALAAVAALCARHDTAADGFWTSILTSSMLRASDAYDVNALFHQPTELARAVRADGLKVLLSWEDRPFQAAVATALTAFLETPRRDGSDTKAVSVGLRVARCGIHAPSLRQLRPAIQRPATAATSQLLFDPVALRRLDLSDNPLDTADLQVVAELLESPSARRVRELVLEPHNDLRDAHFASLHAALVHAPRALCVFCLEGVSSDPQGWATLARLLFTDIPVLNNCHLNVSGLRPSTALVPALLSGLTALVVESIAAILDALETNKRVRCRVFDPIVKPPVASLKHARKAREKALKEPLGRPDLTVYDIVAVDDLEQRVQIVRSSTRSGTQWLSAASIAWLAIDDHVIVGDVRVAGLTIDSRIEHNALMYSTDLTIARLMPVMGPRLRYLRLRGLADQDTPPGSVLHWCPDLEVLDVTEWGQYRLKWLCRDLDAHTFRSLHTVRLSWWNMSESEAIALQNWLAAGANQVLNRLTLSCYVIHKRALHVLADIVQALPTRVTLELDWNRDLTDVDTAAAEAIAVIDARLG